MLENPYPDPAVPTPGILIHGTQRRTKPPSKARMRTLAGAIALVGIAGLGHEALNGWPTWLRLWIVVSIPIAVLWGSFIVVAIGLLAPNPRPPWYQVWSFVDYFDAPHGMRLVVGRLAPDHPGLVVRSGDVVEIHAALTKSARAGLERHYTFRVVAPSGTMEFTAPIWIEHLTMVPLEARAATWGIRITAHGDAAAIQRAGVGV